MRVFGRMSGNRDDRPTDNEAGLVAVSIAARDGQPDLLRQYSDRRDRFVGADGFRAIRADGDGFVAADGLGAIDGDGQRCVAFVERSVGKPPDASLRSA